MNIFRRTPHVSIPRKAQLYRKETHKAASEASKGLTKLNKVMDNGITINIYHAIGGKK